MAAKKVKVEKKHLTLEDIQFIFKTTSKAITVFSMLVKHFNLDGVFAETLNDLEKMRSIMFDTKEIEEKKNNE